MLAALPLAVVVEMQPVQIARIARLVRANGELAIRITMRDVLDDGGVFVNGRRVAGEQPLAQAILHSPVRTVCTRAILKVG
jgi:hypothetical protein